MAHEVERDPARYPGKYKEWALFNRPLGNRDPMAWKIASRWTHKHEELREITMPLEMVDSKLYGISWVDNQSGYEYKIMERDVTKSEWRNESKPK